MIHLNTHIPTLCAYAYDDIPLQKTANSLQTVFQYPTSLRPYNGQPSPDL